MFGSRNSISNCATVITLVVFSLAVFCSHQGDALESLCLYKGGSNCGELQGCIPIIQNECLIVNTFSFMISETSPGAGTYNVDGYTSTTCTGPAQSFQNIDTSCSINLIDARVVDVQDYSQFCNANVPFDPLPPRANTAKAASSVAPYLFQYATVLGLVNVTGSIVITSIGEGTEPTLDTEFPSNAQPPPFTLGTPVVIGNSSFVTASQDVKSGALFRQLSYNMTTYLALGSNNVMTDLILTFSSGESGPLQCSFDFLVEDTIPPSITCFTPILPLIVGQEKRIVSIPRVKAMDNGPLAFITYPQSTKVKGLMEFNLTATATDSAGLTSSCNITIRSVDEEPPILTCPANVTFFVDPTSGQALFVAPTIIAVDREQPQVPVQLTLSVMNNTMLGMGLHRVDVEATDMVGNTATCAFFATIVRVPALVDLANPTSFIKEGFEISLFCEYEAFPRPSITWFVDGVPFKEEEGVLRSDITISEARVNDTGEYYCVADNGFGEVKSTIISIAVRPRLPNCGSMTGPHTPSVAGSLQNTFSPSGWNSLSFSDIQANASSLTFSVPHNAILTTPMGKLLFVRDNRIDAYSPNNFQTPLWSIMQNGILTTKTAGPFILGGSSLFVTSNSASIVAFDAETGSPLFSLLVPSAPAVPCIGDFSAASSRYVVLCSLKNGDSVAFQALGDNPRKKPLPLFKRTFTHAPSSLQDTSLRSTWPPAISVDEDLFFVVAEGVEVQARNLTTGMLMQSLPFDIAKVEYPLTYSRGLLFFVTFHESPSLAFFYRVRTVNSTLDTIWSVDFIATVTGPLSVFDNLLTISTDDNLYVYFADTGERRFKRLVSRASSKMDMIAQSHRAFVLDPYSIMDVLTFNRTEASGNVTLESAFVYLFAVGSKQFIRYTVTSSTQGTSLSGSVDPFFAQTNGLFLTQPAALSHMTQMPSAYVYYSCVNFPAPDVTVRNHHILDIDVLRPNFGAASSAVYYVIVTINGVSSTIGGIPSVSGFLPGSTVYISALDVSSVVVSAVSPSTRVVLDPAPEAPNRNTVFVRVALTFEGFADSSDLSNNFDLMATLREILCENTGELQVWYAFCYIRSVSNIQFTNNRKRAVDGVEVVIEMSTQESRRADVADALDTGVENLRENAAWFASTGKSVDLLSVQASVLQPSTTTVTAAPTSTTASPSASSNTQLVIIIAAVCACVLLIIVLLIIIYARRGSSVGTIPEHEIISMLEKNPFNTMEHDDEDTDMDGEFSRSSTIGGYIYERSTSRPPADLPIYSLKPDNTVRDTRIDDAVQVVQVSNTFIPGAAFDLGFIRDFCSLERDRIDLKINVRQVEGANMHVAEFLKSDDGVAVQSLVWEFLSEQDPSALTANLSQQELISDIIRLDHINLVSAFGICNEQHPLLVVENPSEGSVFRYLQHIKVDETLLFSWIMDIAFGVQYLSNKRIVHGNLWSRECLISSGMRVQLNCSPLLRAVSEAMDMHSTALQFRSTARWAAPETQMRRYSSASDVWAMSVTFWEMFHRCREIPFKEIDDVGEVIRQVKEEGLRLEQPLECPDSLWHHMLTCWSIHRSKRPHINDLVNDLRYAIEEVEDEDALA
eukprot:m.50910 g.50910  ORF g.50910 m.50910 type:complete len:1587 (+) comp7540_c2_seq1:95-4855(+)